MCTIKVCTGAWCVTIALFMSDTKFESGTGWPSFWAPIAQENVRAIPETRPSGMVRTAVACTECDALEGVQYQAVEYGGVNQDAS